MEQLFYNTHEITSLLLSTKEFQFLTAGILALFTWGLYDVYAKKKGWGETEKAAGCLAVCITAIFVILMIGLLITIYEMF